MKKLFMLLMVLSSLAIAGMNITGQSEVQTSIVKWNVGTSTGKTRIRFYTGNVYVDTTHTGTWVRVDNTADSCSQPFLIASDSNGLTRGIYEFRLRQTVKSVNTTLGGHVYRILTTEKTYDNDLKRTRLEPWTISGQNNGYDDVTIQDSIEMLSPRSASKSTQYAHGFVAGTLAKLCPDVLSTTSTAAGDSIIADSLIMHVR